MTRERDESIDPNNDTEETVIGIERFMQKLKERQKKEESEVARELRLKKELLVSNRSIADSVMNYRESRRQLEYEWANPEGLPIDYAHITTFSERDSDEEKDGSVIIGVSTATSLGRTVIITQLTHTKAKDHTRDLREYLKLEPTGVLTIHGESKTSLEPGARMVWDRQIPGMIDWISLNGVEKVKKIAKQLIERR